MLTWTIWKCLQDPSYLWICSKFTSRCQSMFWYDQRSVAWGKAFIDFLKIPPSDAKKQLSEERLFSSFKDLQFALSKIVTKASILSNVCSFIRFCLSLPPCCFYPAAPLSPPKTWSAELFPSSFVGEEILIIRIMRAVYRAISYWQIKRYFKKINKLWLPNRCDSSPSLLLSCNHAEIGLGGIRRVSTFPAV